MCIVFATQITNKRIHTIPTREELIEKLEDCVTSAMGSGASYLRGGRNRPQEVPGVVARAAPSPLRTNVASERSTQEEDVTSEEDEVVAALPKALEVTPRREANMMSSISYTPTADVENVYPFYCPLCMEHFADILSTPKCCGNYICVRCLKDYCATQGLEIVEGYSVNDVLFKLHEAGGMANPNGGGISCPQCMTAPYLPEKVAMSESRVPVSIKSYKDESAVPARVSTPMTNRVEEDDDDPATHSTPGSSEGIAFPRDDNGSGSRKKKVTPDRVSPEKEGNLAIETEYSPVRVGDSFEELKRKMIMFQKPSAAATVSAVSTPCKSIDPGDDTESEGVASPAGFDIRGCSPVRSYVSSFIAEGLARGISAQ